MRPPLSALGVSLEDFIRLIGGGTALCYVIGLLVVQFYLYTLGVSDFALIRTRYILTGFFALIPLSVFVLIILLVIVLVQQWGSDPEDRARKTSAPYERPIAGLSDWLVAVILGSSSLLLVSSIEWRFPATDYLLFGSLGVLAAIGVVGAAVILWARAMAAQLRDYAGAIQILLMFLIAAFLLVLYLDFFANSIYPSVPEQIGGGQSRTVELVITEDAIARGLVADMLGSDASGRSDKLDLVWETQAALILQNPNADDDSLLQIDRSLVSMIIIEPPDLTPRSPLLPEIVATPVP